jgi:DNA (cytosine-5)-methyltransferase 1
MKPKVVSLFAGIGGFDLGLERAGFEVRWQVEIDPFCRKVLDKHWPDVTKYGDIREVNPSELEPVDLICGGFPCQDLSVAGKRAGLAGERSGLFYELLRIADANPSAWVLAENVPGLLSSQRGADFAVVLGELSGFFPEVPADGWRNSGVCYGPKGCVAWRVLDAQYFGVAQRRRRVFIVRSPATARGSAFEVLFEPDCVSGDPPPSRKEGERLTGTPTEGFGSRGVDADQTASGFQNQDLIAPTLAAKNEPANSQVTREEWYTISARLMGAVRRLTPTECERLQGFPGGWTLLGDKTPDSPRYKACGNAVCVNVAEWIGKRIMEALA